MRKLGVRALAALFCAGLAVSVAAAGDTDTDAAPPPKSGWWPATWFNSTPKPEEKKPVVKKDVADEVPSPAELRAREQKAYFRRLAVCDRLREIAIQTHDDALERKVEQLSQQVFDVYMHRTAGVLGTGKFEPADGFTEAPAGKSKVATPEDKP